MIPKVGQRWRSISSNLLFKIHSIFAGFVSFYHVANESFKFQVLLKEFLKRYKPVKSKKKEVVMFPEKGQLWRNIKSNLTYKIIRFNGVVRFHHVIYEDDLHEATLDHFLKNFKLLKGTNKMPSVNIIQKQPELQKLGELIEGAWFIFEENLYIKMHHNNDRSSRTLKVYNGIIGAMLDTEMVQPVTNNVSVTVDLSK